MNSRQRSTVHAIIYSICEALVHFAFVWILRQMFDAFVPSLLSPHRLHDTGHPHLEQHAPLPSHIRSMTTHSRAKPVLWRRRDSALISEESGVGVMPRTDNGKGASWEQLGHLAGGFWASCTPQRAYDLVRLVFARGASTEAYTLQERRRVPSVLAMPSEMFNTKNGLTHGLFPPSHPLP